MVPNLRSGRSAQVPKKQLKSASCHGTSKTAPNRQLKKKKDPVDRKSVICRDPKPHKLIFDVGGLLDGTEVAYCDGGKPLQKGYKADSNIFCYHCLKKVSPSEFEKHAGKGLRRKPYSYIQLENGSSLHQVGMYLQKRHSVDGKSSADGEKALLCDGCRSYFHKDSASLPMNTPAKWRCEFCGREYEQNSNASEVGRVAEVNPIIKTDECTTCVLEKNEETKMVCPLCSIYKYCDCQFGPLTLIACVQCEKQFHVCCLKERGKSDLKAKPKGKWFCSLDCDSNCEKIFSTLHKIIRNQHMDERLLNISTKAVRWRLLCAKSTYNNDKLLSDATSILYENFGTLGRDDISVSGDDLIRDMVYGKKEQNRRMYMAVVTVESKVVAAGLFRVLGQDFAELPLAATAKANQGKGYFRLLIVYIEKLLTLLNVRSFVLPATESSITMWKEKFGFQEMSPQQKEMYEENCWNVIDFQNTFMLHKVIPEES